MDADEIVVDIPQGTLRGGKTESALGPEYYYFKGIPYARPPVGELRFKAPQPADKWTGILDATREPTCCPCADTTKTYFLKQTEEGSLFVNVYCRQNPKAAGGKKCPVMVWFHGGGFEFGSGNKDMNGPDYLMLQDVVLVTFNYRLGVLGFLSLQTVECPGNFGLKDQQLALKWVKSNIGFFGGDPDNITLFGVSAGGASVHYQTLSLSNKDLFQRAILQSGAVLNRWAFSRRPREYAFALGRRMGCDTDDDGVLLDFLRKAPVEDIVMKGIGVINEVEGKVPGEWFVNFTFVPTVEPEHEGAFLTEHPWLLMKEGRYLDVPLITGVTSEEMILGLGNPEDYPRLSDVSQFQQLIPRDIQLPKDGEESLALAKRIKEFYFKNGVTLESYIDFLSDNFFNYGVLKHAKCRMTNSNIKSPTYLYLFTYDGDQPFLKEILQLNIKGACHGDDTMYLFFQMDLSDLDKMQPGSRDYNFMRKLTALWVNFATTGVPTLDEAGFAWTEASSQDFPYLELSDNFVMKKGLLRERMEFWDEIYTAYYDRKHS